MNNSCGSFFPENGNDSLKDRKTVVANGKQLQRTVIVIAVNQKLICLCRTRAPVVWQHLEALPPPNPLRRGNKI